MASKDYWIDPEELSKLGQELASENSDFEIKDSDINSLEGITLPTKYTSNDESIANENNFDITKIQTQLAETKKRAQKALFPMSYRFKHYNSLTVIFLNHTSSPT